MVQYDRNLIEDIKRARTIRIVINEGTDDEKFFKSKPWHNNKKLAHDVAIAVQDYLVKNERP